MVGTKVNRKDAKTPRRIGFLCVFAPLRFNDRWASLPKRPETRSALPIRQAQFQM
jgi:hypothetical protein